MSSSSPPPAPVVPTAAEQSAGNIATAQATNTLNNPNTITPGGTTTFASGDTFDQAGYDKAYANYQAQLAAPHQIGWFGNRNPNAIVPNRADFNTLGRDTMAQTLSPEQQAIYSQNQQNELGTGQLANQGIDALQGIVGTQVDYSGAPAAPQDSEAIRKQVVDAMMSRNDPRLTQAAEQQDADLIAAGIRPGTEAWDRVKTEQGQNRNDALMQAQLAGGQESSRAYGMDEASRKNYIAELLSQRQIPLNEITALMSGSQTQNPFAGQGNQAGASVKPTDYFSGSNMLNQYNQDIYNQNVGTQNNQMATAGTIAVAII